MLVPTTQVDFLLLYSAPEIMRTVETLVFDGLHSFSNHEVFAQGSCIGPCSERLEIIQNGIANAPIVEIKFAGFLKENGFAFKKALLYGLAQETLYHHFGLCSPKIIMKKDCNPILL